MSKWLSEEHESSEDESSNDPRSADEGTESRESFIRDLWLLLKAISAYCFVCIMLIFIVCDVMLMTVVEIDSDDAAALALGVVFAQITLLAVWTALASVSFAFRVLSGGGAAGLVALAILISVVREDHASSHIGWSIGGATIVMWLTIQVPLWCIRIFGGWRLGAAEQVDEEQQSTQYGLKQLMIWMAAVGIWLGVVRFLIPEMGSLGSDREFKMALVLFGIFVVFNSLFALPVVWAALTHRLFLLWIFLSFVCYWVLSAAEVFALTFALGRSGDESIFWVINALQYAAVGIPLLLLRFCGVRLIRDNVLR